MEHGICKLCLLEKDLCQSHIIPKFVFKPTEDELNRSIPISVTEVFKAVQSGLKEPMLCRDCEEIFQKYEDQLKLFLSDLQQLKPPNMQRSENVILTQNYDYDFIKLGVISIIWRLSHTTLKEFKKAFLGTYQEKFRTILLNKTSLPLEKYPVMSKKIVFNNNLIDGMIMNFDMSTHESYRFKIQSVCLYGTIFEVLMHENIGNFFETSNQIIFLGSNYSPVILQDLKEIFGQNNKLLGRFFEKDVSNAMSKLRPKK